MLQYLLTFVVLAQPAQPTPAPSEAPTALPDVAPSDVKLGAIQAALVEHGGTQCGICTPGIALAAHSALQREPDAGRGRLRELLAGNLCRCTGYVNIVKAIQQAAGQLGAAESAPVVAAETTNP